jgi:hypothetical protein
MRLRCAHATLALAFVLVLAVPVAGCGGPQGSTFDYPKDGELRLHQLQAKGTHNSYHIAPEGDLIPALEYTHMPLDVQLASQGVRQVELDVRYDMFQERFDVFHENFDEGTTCPTLVDCLSSMKAWSDASPAHHPLFIQLELKDGTTAEQAEDYFSRLEAEVLSVFPRERVIAPDDVRGDAASVREAVTSKGWPTLGEARGKVLFFIDDTSEVQGYYTHGKQDLDGRLMFIDGEPSDPFAGILVSNDPIGEAALIEESVSAGLLVRTRADSDNVEPLAGDTSRRDAAFASGAHFVSTDYPAPVEGVDYVVEVPGGTPSRCNPRTAPEGCAPEDIEDPAYVGQP